MMRHSEGLWAETESGRLLRPTCRENTFEVHLIHKILKDSNTFHIGDHQLNQSNILTQYLDFWVHFTTLVCLISCILTLFRVDSSLSGDSGDAHCTA